jgi:hypothetical protein
MMEELAGIFYQAESGNESSTVGSGPMSTGFTSADTYEYLSCSEIMYRFLKRLIICLLFLASET